MLPPSCYDEIVFKWIKPEKTIKETSVKRSPRLVHDKLESQLSSQLTSMAQTLVNFRNMKNLQKDLTLDPIANSKFASSESIDTLPKIIQTQSSFNSLKQEPILSKTASKHKTPILTEGSEDIKAAVNELRQSF